MDPDSKIIHFSSAHMNISHRIFLYFVDSLFSLGEFQNGLLRQNTFYHRLLNVNESTIISLPIYSDSRDTCWRE